MTAKSSSPQSQALLAIIGELSSTLLNIREFLDAEAREQALAMVNALTVQAFAADLVDVASAGSRLRFELESPLATEISVDDCYWALNLSLKACAIEAFIPGHDGS